MKRRSDEQPDDLRARILGLGEFSVHKSYYPQLQEKLAELRLFFDSVNDAILVHDAETYTILDANRRACEMLGNSHEEMIGLTIEHLHADSAPYTGAEAIKWLSKAKSGEPLNFEWLAKHRSGRRFWVEVSLSFVRAGSKSRIMVVMHDLTERKRSEEILRQSEKLTAIGQLAGGVAHDFNNQLGAILGYADLLNHELHGEQAQHLPAAARSDWTEYVQRIVLAAQRSADLTRNLLAFSRKGQNECTSVDLAMVVEETIVMLGRSIDKRITIEREITSESTMVRGDASQFQNAILNLGLNARDAMPDGGTLCISLSRTRLQENSLSELSYVVPTGDYLLVSVQDTGCGMSKEVQAHIFEPFYTTKPLGKGTGLGLAAVYGTMRQYDGAITVESEPGKGSTFRLYIPAIDAEIPAEEPESPLRVSGHGGRRVFIVEDEILLRDLAATILKDAGYDVLSAMNGTEAMEIFGKEWQSIDVVLLDVVMPGISGLQLFQAMKGIDPQVAVIVTSGYSFDDDIQTLFQEGAQAFLKKPYYLNELLRLVEDTAASGTPPAHRPMP